MSTLPGVPPVLISFSQTGRSAHSTHPYSAPSHQRELQRLPSARLTPRQLEVLKLLAEGLPNKLISRRLGISASTVKCHVACILRELDADSRLKAVVLAYELGLIDPTADSANPQRRQS